MTYKENDNQSRVAAYEPHNNLKYGVYALRAQYHITIIKSLLLVCAILGSISLISRLAPAGKKMVEIDTGNFPDTSIFTITVDLPEPVTEPAAPQPPADPAPVQRSETSTILISDNEPTVEPPATLTTQGEQGSSVISENTGSGANTSTAASTGTSTGSNTTIASPYMVEVMPEFEGGLQALHNFIAAHVRYPEQARESGKGGTVHVQFVVDTDGSISRITLLNKAGFGMDEEATRVISLLPKFKTPGMSKGVPVRVYYTMPIKFKIQ